MKDPRNTINSLRAAAKSWRSSGTDSDLRQAALAEKKADELDRKHPIRNGADIGISKDSVDRLARAFSGSMTSAQMAENIFKNTQTRSAPSAKVVDDLLNKELARRTREHMRHVSQERMRRARMTVDGKIVR